MFPNEEYMKTAFNGVNEELQRRPVAYEKYDIHTVSAEWKDQTESDIIATPFLYVLNGDARFCMCLVTEDLTNFEDAIKDKTVILNGNSYYDSIISGEEWTAIDGGYTIGVDYKNGGNILPGAIAILKANTIYSGITYPKCGIYVAGVLPKGSDPTVRSKGFSSISWTYKTPRYVQLPQKLLDTDQADWQENDPTAPSYVKNRMGGYDVSQTIEKSAEYPTDGSVNAFYIDRAGGVNWYADQIGKDTEGLLDALQLGTVEYHYRSNSSIQSFTWTITDDYAYTNEKMGNNWPIAFALFNTTPLPVSGFEGITEPGVYVLGNDFTTTSSIIDALFWTYTETKTIQIPEKYIPDAALEKDTMVVKFTPISDSHFACEANYSIDEIYEAYDSGKVIIKGALLADGYVLSDGTCEVNDTCVCFKFVANGIIGYVLMDPRNEKIGYVLSDDNTLHFESDSSFTLKVTTPGWNGQIYAQGKLWKGSQISSVYFDGKYRMYLYGTNNTKITGSGSNHEFVLTGSNIRVAGNLKNLLDVINSNISMLGYCFYKIFASNTALVDASDLEMMPNYSLSMYCYCGMFSGCHALAMAPELPATTLAEHCYEDMFDNCDSLMTPPKLPATTLASYCYAGMFSYCVKLTETPELPATTLASSCYSHMFYYDNNLKKISKLPATILTDYCYNSMFNECLSVVLSSVQSDEYPTPYRIPYEGTGDAGSAKYPLNYMFLNIEGGGSTNTPSINTTYYLHKSCSIVGMTDDPKPVPKTDEMTQPVGMDKWTGELFTKPGESGGSSNIFAVKFTINSSTNITADHTYEEINTAIYDGKYVYGYIESLGCLLHIELNAADDNIYRFTADAVEESRGFSGIVVSLDVSSNGITMPSSKNIFTKLFGNKTDEMTQRLEGGIDTSTGDLYIKPISGNKDLGLTGATVGQIAKITAVDSDGKPTAWEPADLPSGGGGDWVFAGSVTAESAGMALKVSNIHAKHILVSLYASCDDTSNRSYNIVFNDVLHAQHMSSLPGNSVKHLWAVEFDLLAAGDENYIYSRVWPNETHHTNTSNDPQTIMNTTTLSGTMWYKVGISEFNSVTFASTNGTASAGNIMNVWYR